MITAVIFAALLRLAFVVDPGHHLVADGKAPVAAGVASVSHPDHTWEDLPL
ncbi:hypothetical protein PGT21_002369 [Puccinia graminis f. sp. tritici]|uniref:Uncharacterized protein n=1 Tax=Puccinia graminis f. sp. tritici TaxID=56615 RepID=A0A5B0RZF7_PUCGR|nr:hypothetical protein PGT21_002369 [Puccinia graminis f. sp. tritici]KAA1129984.1 hypothetical protein PGTUg99_006771 [Puccinia graminis f. sp. tritici]